MKLILDPQVHVDVLGIMEYYEEVAGTDLAVDFYLEFRSCIDRIAEWPMMYAIYKDRYRRVNLRRFPIHILYRVVDDQLVRVLAIRHDRRDPDFGLISRPAYPDSDKLVPPAYNLSFTQAREPEHCSTNLFSSSISDRSIRSL